jgi:hypothetical protein
MSPPTNCQALRPAGRVLHLAERNITDKGGKESSAMDTLLRLNHHALWAS